MDEHVEGILLQNPSVDRTRLAVLLSTVPPTVYVIADRWEKQWEDAIRFERAIFGVFEIYRRRDVTDFAFRVNGDAPIAHSTLLSKCSHYRSIPRLMRLDTPSAIDLPTKSKVLIDVDGSLQEWIIVRDGLAVFLDPVGGNLLAEGCTYELHDASGNLILRKGRPN